MRARAFPIGRRQLECPQMVRSSMGRSEHGVELKFRARHFSLLVLLAGEALTTAHANAGGYQRRRGGNHDGLLLSSQIHGFPSTSRTHPCPDLHALASTRPLCRCAVLPYRPRYCHVTPQHLNGLSNVNQCQQNDKSHQPALRRSNYYSAGFQFFRSSVGPFAGRRRHLPFRQQHHVLPPGFRQIWIEN